jgi:uncharacterized protein
VDCSVSVYPDHVPAVNGAHLEMGGAMLTPESIEPGAERKMIGSTMVVVAESLADARELVESDVYYKSGVVCTTFPRIFNVANKVTSATWQWDPEKLVITPFVAVGMTAE